MGSIFSGEDNSLLGDWRKTKPTDPYLSIAYKSHEIDNSHTEFEGKFYKITFEVTARNLKNYEGQVYVSPQIGFPTTMTKVSLKRGASTVECNYHLSPTDTLIDGTVRASIVADGFSANSKEFAINVELIQKEGGRMPIDKLQPSSKFFLSLKEKEGLGYNIVKDDENEIIRVFPYDDGGKMGKGFATIGWGHLIDKKPFDSNNPIHKKWKNGITLEEAEQLLFKDVANKSNLLIAGLGDGKTKGIKVNLLQREYDALLLAIFNGGYGTTLENTINKGVENLSKEEIYRAFLYRRYTNKKESRGLIKRRAMEADIFINDNWMPFPSEKYKDYNKYIEYFQKFLKTGVLTLLIICFSLSAQNKAIKHNGYSDVKLKEYQDNSLLYDINDKKINLLDTTLSFSDSHFLYKIALKHGNVILTQYRWSELPNNKFLFRIKGRVINGFIYMIHKNGEEELLYKIILNKALFEWNGSNWIMYNSGDN